MSEALQGMMRAVLNEGGQASRLASPAVAETRAGDLHLAAELTRMADRHANQGKQLEAESLYLRANAIRERLLTDSDPLLLSGYCDLALLYDSMQLYERSEPIYKKIAAGWQSSVADGEGSMLARSLSDLAGVYLAQGKYSEAEQTYRQAQSTLQNLYGPDNAQVVDLLERLASIILERFLASQRLDDGHLLSACEAYFELGLFYQGQREYGQAARLFRRAIAGAEGSGSAAESLFALESERLEQEDNLLPLLATFAHSMQAMATACFCQGRYLESEALAKRALVLNVRASGREHHSVARSLQQLAECFFRTGKYARATAHYRQSLLTREGLFGKNHPEVTSVLCALAKSCLAQGDLRESEQLLGRAIEILEMSGNLDSPLAAQIFNCIADMSNMKGLHDQASSFAGRALSITEALAVQNRREFLADCSEAKPAVQNVNVRPNIPDTGRIDLKLLRLLAEGTDNSEVAKRSSSSSFAVNRALAVLMKKLSELSSLEAQEFLRQELAGLC